MNKKINNKLNKKKITTKVLGLLDDYRILNDSESRGRIYALIELLEDNSIEKKLLDLLFYIVSDINDNKEDAFDTSKRTNDEVEKLEKRIHLLECQLEKAQDEIEKLNKNLQKGE